MVVVLLALVAAFANAVGSICQRIGVEGAHSSGGSDVMSHALRRPVWLVGMGIMTASFGVQAVALHLGALATVEPTLVATLPIIAVALWAVFGFDVRVRDLVSCAAASGGLAIFLIVAAPTNGTSHTPISTWLIAGGLVVAAAILCLVAARGRPAWGRAILIGAAASLGFALTAATTKAATDELTASAARLFTTWPLYALAVVGLTSFVLMQRAFRAGPFAASESAIVLVSPFVSIALGSVLFGDGIDTSAGALLVEIPALIVMAVGAVFLCASPLVSAVSDENDDSAALAGRRRRKVAT